jgi:hypothetical protein
MTATAKVLRPALLLQLMKPDQALVILSQLIQRLTLSHAEAYAVNAALQSLASAIEPPKATLPPPPTP